MADAMISTKQIWLHLISKFSFLTGFKQGAYPGSGQVGGRKVAKSWTWEAGPPRLDLGVCVVCISVYGTLCNSVKIMIQNKYKSEM